MTDDTPTVRTAVAEDRISVLRLLEGALLDVDPQTVSTAITDDRVLVVGDPITGALVATQRSDSTHVTAIAVHPHHRRTGLGTALITAAADRWGQLIATFDERAYPFYDALDCTITQTNGRWQATYPPDEASP